MVCKLLIVFGLMLSTRTVGGMVVGPRQGCVEGTVSFDACDQRCKCVGGRLVDCVRIRKEVTTMTPKERRRYIAVIKKASSDPQFKERYDNLVAEYLNLMGSAIHQTTFFLPWHRYYILRYENLLREVDCRFATAYWDWSAVSSDPFDASSPRSLWYSSNIGFGGNGEGSDNCVQSGPFRENEFSLVPIEEGDSPGCLERDFDGKCPDMVAVAEVLKYEPDNFTDFELALRVDLHGTVHCIIGGTMCSVETAAAPEFFLHHSFIDKIWSTWQKKSEYHANVFFSTIDEVMTSTQILAKEVLDLNSQPGGVRVKYQLTKREIEARKKYDPMTFDELRRIHRPKFTPADDRVFKLFRVPPSEIARSKELQKLLEPPGSSP